MQQQDDRSLGELFGDLARDTGLLVRQEMELAKAEMTRSATRVGKDIGFLVAGGAVAYAGFLGILAAIAVGLGQLGVPWWLAILLVGLVVAGVGGLLVQRGLTALRGQGPAAAKAIQADQEDGARAKAQTK